jgi:hypothetical protein
VSSAKKQRKAIEAWKRAKRARNKSDVITVASKKNAEKKELLNDKDQGQ